ncbi:two-partner secretion domain-containing protein [Actinobacillus delphinicola]|uniref:Protein PfhB2 n=1 Tax=Actinobacillus delphinicola TaxID=51161 RepID=A0A448TUC3_9PAST|nr:hemagglutinin repeat-containing protein [Actinobacillus delphinicola]VEJ09589.1 protein PfhB2 [Actinobacillus delphinicola]
MNKNKYKLIFSKSKLCMIPVAENITTASGANKDKSEKNQTDNTMFFGINRLSALVHINLSSFKQIVSLKALSAFILATSSVTTFASDALKEINNIRVDNTQTTLRQAQNGTVIVDIAKPEFDGISDNRFKEFSTQNGAVFNNSLQNMQSQLAGNVSANSHLQGNHAKAILNQVTGNDRSYLQGGLEVLGGKADLLIINPHGVTINGVQTYNTDRFVVSTSNVIDPKKGLHLDVDKGDILIGKDGLATDGLSYLDLVAKKIHLQGAIAQINKQKTSGTEINLVAGSSQYDVKNRQVKSKNVTNNDVVITGDEAGAMYGKRINFITTDSGAGVKHKGIILSESDLNFDTNKGSVDLDRTHAKRKIHVKNTKDLTVRQKLEASQITIDTDSLHNEGAIKAARHLNIKTKGVNKNTHTNDFHNNGEIISNDKATLTFKDKTSFDAAKHKLVKAKNDLTLNTEEFNLDKSQKVELGSNFHLNSTLFENKGRLIGTKDIDLSVTGPIQNHGIIGSKGNLLLQSKNSSVNNFATGSIFTEGFLNIDAKHEVYNLGDIFAKNKITIAATHLTNDAKLKGQVTTANGNTLTANHYHYHSSRYDDYHAELKVPEFQNQLGVESFGRIHGENGFKFIQKSPMAGEKAGIFNHSILSINGRFDNEGTKQIVNQAKNKVIDLISDYLKKPAEASVSFTPRALLFNSGLSGTVTLKAQNLYGLLNQILSNEYPLKTWNYYGSAVEAMKTLKSVKSETFQKMMTVIFGQNWDQQNYQTLKENWASFNNHTESRLLNFYSSANKAKLLASEITGQAQLLKNGYNGEKGKYQRQIKIGEKFIKVPEVTFASLEDVDNAVLKAGIIKLKTQQTHNVGDIKGQHIDIEAKQKIINEGNIIGDKEVRLKGHKGIESKSTVIVNGDGSTSLHRANIQSKGHLHLETDRQHDIDIEGSNVEGKTGFIKTKNLNLKDVKTTSSERKETNIHSRLSNRLIGTQTTEQAKVKSEGTNAEFDHLHLAIEGDVNQNGSDVKTKRLTGIVKGNYNTKAGEQITHTEKSENVTQIELGIAANVGGKKAALRLDERKGFEANVTDDDKFGLTADSGIRFINEKSKRTELTHKNSQLTAETGTLHVLGNANIGGVDINANITSTPPTAGTNNVPTENKGSDNTKISPIPKLSESEIQNLMSEKNADFYKKEAQSHKQEKNQGFTLDAQRITSEKQKDELHESQTKSNLKIGLSTEGHSAIGDTANKIIRHSTELVKGDANAALKLANDALSGITGDAIGGSLTGGLDANKSTKVVDQTSDNRTRLGGNTRLVSHSDIELKNIESNKDSNITLKAQNNVTLKAGETDRHETSQELKIQTSATVSGSCGLTSSGCAIGINHKIGGDYNRQNTTSKTFQNSKLQGNNISISAGKDLTLAGANVTGDHVHLDVKGKTHVESKQDELNRRGYNAGLHLNTGASIATDLSVKPSINISAKGGIEVENKRQVNEQSGIKANALTGHLENLKLVGGHIIGNKSESNLTVANKISANELQDSHHKDGGNLGLSIKIDIKDDGDTDLSKSFINGGRAAQKHYEATQNVTVIGVNPAQGIDGKTVNQLNQQSTITQNTDVAASQIQLSPKDIKDIVDKAKNAHEKAEKIVTKLKEAAHTVKEKLSGIKDTIPAPQQK